MNSAIFKTYDIRGIYPNEIDEQSVSRIAQALVSIIKPKNCALGRDVRQSSPALFEAAKKSLIEAGVDVYDIGQISTDMLYFAVSYYGLDAGITITASHNPREYNGMKMIEKGSAPIFEGHLLPEIKTLAMDPNFSFKAEKTGQIFKKEVLADYIVKVKEISGFDRVEPMKIVLNGNFGLGGKIFKEIVKDSPLELIELNCEPDGTFPKGRPDPLVPENREETLAKIKETGADLGFAWDADADRCFVYNEKGEAVDGSFMGSLLAQIVLEKKEKGQTVIYDPRIVWAVRETVESLGGAPFPTKVGHAFIKHKMREKNAVLAVEGSGHFYFRDFYFCDNGMISALLILCYLNEKKRPLSEILSPLTTRYFVSGEINFTAENKDEIVEALKNDYAEGKFDDLDGISIEYPDFRFNVRKSNTEPLLRLNLEARSAEGLEQKKKELVEKIEKLKK